jgi:pimeloyl-ACP methyl ester carboxylesterase
MATFVLIPGAGGQGWYWHLVTARLEAAGHQVVAPDLPATDEHARLADYVDVVLRALDGSAGGDLVVVGQSMGGLTAPLVCAQAPARLLVLVAAMIPRPGESGGQWWANTGQPAAAAALAQEQGRDLNAFDPMELFLHDLPAPVLAEVLERPVEQCDGPFLDPWPLSGWPDVPTRVVACRHDRLFPLEFMRKVSHERLGLAPDVVDTGHLPALADPAALSALLDRYWLDLD